MTDERIKEEFERIDEYPASDECKAFALLYKHKGIEYAMGAGGFYAGVQEGERIGKIEVLEELMEFIHTEHQTPSSIVAHLSRRINELSEAQS